MLGPCVCLYTGCVFIGLINIGPTYGGLRSISSVSAAVSKTLRQTDMEEILNRTLNNNYNKPTAADDTFYGIGKIADVANRRRNKHILVARVRRDRQQQFTVKECTNANRHDTDVHISNCPSLLQRGLPVSRQGLGYEDDCQPQDWRLLPSAIWCGENVEPKSGQGVW